jgi:hypothetical protein
MADLKERRADHSEDSAISSDSEPVYVGNVVRVVNVVVGGFA